MGSIVAIKSELKSPELLMLLSESIGLPSLTKLYSRAEGYMENTAIEAYALKEDGGFYGLIVVERKSETEIVIRNIAVGQKHRRHGVGRQLIRFVLDQHRPKTLTAETDDDAVGFYRSCGFEITNLGEKYPGIVRYACSLSRSEA